MKLSEMFERELAAAIELHFWQSKLINVLQMRMFFSKLVESGMSGGECRRCQRPYLSRSDSGLCPPCNPDMPEIAEDRISREGWLSRDWSKAASEEGELVDIEKALGETAL